MKTPLVRLCPFLLTLACTAAQDDGAGNPTGGQGGGGAPVGAGGVGVGGMSSGVAGASAGSSSVGGAVGGGGTTSAAGASAAGANAAGAGGAAAGSGGASAAGAAGAAGAGEGGSAGSVSMAGAGAMSGPSAGCQAPFPPDEENAAVRHDMTVTVAPQYQPAYVDRYYFTQTPVGYDHATPYPLVIRGNGCGQTSAEGGSYQGSSDVFLVQAISASVTGDTVEPPGGAPGCFQAGRKGLADSPDGPYFDQIVAEVAATYCVDLDQIYVTGWSSGAWLSNYLACARGNVIRGTASGSGGLQADHGPCTGGAAVMIFPGDAGSTNEDGVDIGAAVARDLFITTNGCSTTPTTMSFGAAGNCDYYGDCAAPVVYCHDGGGHGGPLGFLQDSSWEFWNSFP